MNKILLTASIYTFVKFILFFLNYGNHYVALKRAGVGSVSFPLKTLIAVLILAVCIAAQKEFGKCKDKIKNKILLIISSLWLYQCFFVNTTTKNFNYLTLLCCNMTSAEHMYNCLVLDFLYDSPHILFWIIFLAASYIILKNFKLEKYCLFCFLLPFCDVFQLNIYSVIILISALSAALFAIIAKRDYSYSLFTVLLLAFHLLHSIIYITVVGTQFVIMPLIIEYTCIFLLAFLYIRTCKKNNLYNLGWLFPGFILLFIIQCTDHLKFGSCLTSSLVYTSMYIGSSIIPALITIGISNYIARFNKKIGTISYLLITSFFVLTYSLDSLLYYSSNMKLDVNVLKWMLSMSDFSKLVKSASAYIDTTIIITILLLITGIILILGPINSFLKKNYKGQILVICFIFCNTCLLIANLRSFVPIPVKDPFIQFILSNIKNTISDNNIKEPEKAFAAYETPLRYHKPQNIKVQNIKYNLIHITLESVHWHYLSLFGENKTWPCISKYKDRIDLYTNIYSCFPESGNGDFSVLSGLYSPQDIFLPSVMHYQAPTLANDLKNAGYNCMLYASAYLDDGNISALANPLVYSQIKDCMNLSKDKSDLWEWGVKEEVVVKKIINSLKDSGKEPFFLWYRMIYPHQPLTVLDQALKKEYPDNPKEPENQVSKYKTALRYIDIWLAKLIEEIDKMNLPYPTIISMAADHGEMLGENEYGKIRGHGILVSPKLTNIPFIVIRPASSSSKGLNVNKRLGAQKDISETLLDYLDITPTSGRYTQGQSLISDSYKPHPIYLTSIQCAAVIEDDIYIEFKDLNDFHAEIYQIKEDKNFKMSYPRIKFDNKEFLEKKRKKINDFFKLQKSFLNSIVNSNN